MSIPIPIFIICRYLNTSLYLRFYMVLYMLRCLRILNVFAFFPLIYLFIIHLYSFLSLSLLSMFFFFFPLPTPVPSVAVSLGPPGERGGSERAGSVRLDRPVVCIPQRSYGDLATAPGRWGGWGDGREERCLYGCIEEIGTCGLELGVLI